MKSIKLLISFTALIIGVLCLPACKKSLEEKPYSSLSSTEVFTSETGLSEATLGIYETFVNNPWANWYRFMFAESQQQYSMQGQFGANNPELDQFAVTSQSGTAGQLDQLWSQDFQAISRANTVIANATKAVPDTTIANKYIAEARFLRGYAYFELVRYFGGVPLISQQLSSSTQTSLIYGKRASLQDTYNFIVSDMIAAAAGLPAQWTGSNVGRVNAGTALAFLGKIYLTMAGKPLQASGYYQKAVAVLNEVVGPNEGKYGFALQTNFVDVFSASNKRNSEIMIDFSEFSNSSHTVASLFPFFFLPCGIKEGNEQTTIGSAYGYYQLFGSGDTRRDETLIPRYLNAASSNAPIGDSIIYNVARLRYIDTTTHIVFANNTVNQGVAYGKCDRNAAYNTNPFYYPIDFVPFRFADAILCLAEAEIESGDNTDALVLINRVRARAHATLYTDATDMEARVRLERRLELGAEFNTQYDIRRWGTLATEVAAMSPNQVSGSIKPVYNAKFELFPIPLTEIEANPALTQNPGY